MTSLTLARLRGLRLPRISPATRISAGLIALIMSSLLLLDVAIGLIPDPQAEQLQARKRSAETLAVLVTELMGNGDQKAVTRGLESVLARNDDVRSVAVRQSDGRVLVQLGDHAHQWSAPPPGQSTINHARIALSNDGRHWADVEVSFKHAPDSVLQRLIANPLMRLIVALGLCGFVLVSLYLRRVLNYLDPSTVIPERVRAAFDAFTEGVMVLDTTGRVILANTTFLGWLGEEFEKVMGRPAHSLNALSHLNKGDPKAFPWMQSIALKQPLTGDMMELKGDAQNARKTTVNCAPIMDGRGGVRGCIVTFDDVSELESANQSLRLALDDLERSRGQIEKQNDELRKLATRDPLTGCLNRRAFFEAVAPMFSEAQANKATLHCIMSDIDHFKSFNDRYGHAVGDQVLQSTTKQLFSGLRDSDLLCRYGGEEFCIMLQGINTEQAQRVAERLRAEIEANAGQSVRSIPGLSVTSSFGLAVFSPELEDAAKLVARADEALYEAKRSGRNRVVLWRAGDKAEA